MNLQHLRTFVEVWRTRSISRASTALNITQPAASGHIRTLEAELGYPLFHRHARGVEPTVVANELAGAIGTSLDGAEAAFERLRLRSDEMTGVVHLAGPAEFTGARLPAAVAALTALGIQLHLRFGGRDSILSWLAKEEVELAITAYEPDDPAFGYRAVFEERFLVVAAPSLDLKAPPRADWPWLSYDAALPLIRSYLASEYTDVPARPVLTAGSLTFLRDAAAAGAGVAVLPDYICRSAIEDGSLVIVDRADALPVNRIFLVWRKAALRLPRVVFARNELLKELAL